MISWKLKKKQSSFENIKENVEDTKVVIRRSYAMQ